jgi:hypothetical protein
MNWRINYRVVVYFAAAALLGLGFFWNLQYTPGTHTNNLTDKQTNLMFAAIDVFGLCLGTLVGGLTAAAIAFLANEHRRLSRFGPLPWRAYAQAPRKLHSIFLISRPQSRSASPPSPKALSDSEG